jgi:hypothetical protein
MAITTML